MILNAIVCFLVACMVFTWSKQGLFSAIIHLVLTLLAGAVAFALWEPLVQGLIIRLAPEQAWGLGLLLPFGVTLLVLRTLFDKFVPGNLNFHNLVDRAGGAAVGFGSAVLTTGLLVLGLQMIGLPSLAGFQAYKLDESGRVSRQERLWIPVDTVTAGFFSSLSGGAMSPLFSRETLPRFQPDLAKRASLFHQSAFWTDGPKSARRSLRPDNIKLIENSFSIISEAPPGLPDNIRGDGSKRFAVIGTDIAVKAAEGPGAGDSDGVFRASRAQISLVAEDSSGKADVIYPIGYIQEGEFKALNVEGSFAYSGVSSTVQHHWMFELPPGATPLALYLKQVRIALPDRPQNSDVAVVEQLITYVGGGQIAAAGPDPSTAPPANSDFRGDFAMITAALPIPVNRNRITAGQNVGIDDDTNSLISGTFRYVPNRDDGYAPKLVINSVYHPATAAVVRVNIKDRREGQSLYGKAIQQVNVVTQTPILETVSGKKYRAIGYAVAEAGAWRISVDANTYIRSLTAMELGRTVEEDAAYLYFLVDSGETIVNFTLGQSNLNAQPLNLKIP